MAKNKFFDNQKITGLGIISLGIIFLFYAMHILTINSFDKTADSLNMLFIILMGLVSPLAILFVLAIFFRLIKYLIWVVKTPKSKRDEEDDD